MLGFRRIDFVHVTVTPDCVQAHVAGVGHRATRELAVPLRTASRLVTQGVPLVVQHVGTPDRPRSPTGGSHDARQP
jgi:hypothetical protein